MHAIYGGDIAKKDLNDHTQGALWSDLKSSRT